MIRNRDDFETIDLREMTRMAGSQTLVESKVDMKHRYTVKPWVRLGEVTLVKGSSREGPSRWTLKALLKEGIMDGDHSPAYAFGIDLVAVEYEYTTHGLSRFSGIVAPNDSDSFQVPVAGYAKELLKRAKGCKSCAERGAPHIIVDRFFPPPNEELYKQFSGREVLITIGPGPFGVEE